MRIELIFRSQIHQNTRPWKPLNNLKEGIAKPRPKYQLSPDPLLSLAIWSIGIRRLAKSISAVWIVESSLIWVVSLCCPEYRVWWALFLYTRMRTKNVARLGLQIHNYITSYPNSFNLVNNSTNLWGNYLKQTRLVREKNDWCKTGTTHLIQESDASYDSSIIIIQTYIRST